MMATWMFIGAFAFGFFTTVSCLSCYTCDNEDWNWGGCTTNFVQCKSFQDACASYTAYRLPVTYNPRGERYHHIYKGCDTQHGCARRQSVMDQTTCVRTSYNDWACVECCIGDLCNYYITLGAKRLQISFIAIIAALLAHLWFRQYQ